MATKKKAPDSLALARQASGIVTALPEAVRADIEKAMPSNVRAFYYALTETRYNATAALRRVEGDDQSKLGRSPAQSTFRSRARQLRRRADVEVLVADDMREMAMSAAEAKAHLAEVAHNADMTLFVDEVGRINPDAVRLYGSAVKRIKQTMVSTDDGKGDILQTEIELYDRPKVLDMILKHLPQDEGGSKGADAPTVNFFTQINPGSAPQDI